MTRLAVWTIDPRNADGASRSEPQKTRRSQIRLERQFEDWIVNDVTLLG